MATTFSWTGGGSTPSWSNAFNWSPIGVPGTGDSLVFNGGGTSNNNLTTNTRFNTISVTNHRILGNAISLDNGLTVNDAEIHLAKITLNANQSFSAATADNESSITSGIDLNGKTLLPSGPGDLTLSGIISGGTGGIFHTGTGVVTLSGNNTYTGVTRQGATGGAIDGVFQIFGSQPGSTVEVGGGTLAGAGTLGAVRLLFADAKVAPGSVNNGTGILTMKSLEFDRVFSPGNPEFLVVDLNGIAPGTGYDQVRITNPGVVDIGSDSGLTVSLGAGFAPAPGDTFVLINNEGSNPIAGDLGGGADGAFITAGSRPFFVTTKGGDGNDLVLSVPATWDGGGADNNWMTAANWLGNVAPVPGQALFFPANASRRSNTNNYPNGTFFPGIVFSGTYTIGGNAITLGAGGLIAGQATVASVSNDITLAAPGLIRADAGGAIDTTGDFVLGSHRLTVNTLSNSRVSFAGPIAGSGEIHKFGGELSRLDINGPVSVSAIRVFGGDMDVGSPVAAPVILDGFTELTGDGSIGPLTIGGSSVSGGRLSGAGRLTVNGSLVMPGNAARSAILAVDLAGATGNNQDKLIVNGAVQLAKADVLIRLKNGFAPAVGATFVIITNDGTDPVLGTFAMKPEGATFVVDGTAFRISYQGGDGNDVVLTVVSTAPGPAAPPSLANISTRLRVQSGENVLIGGMIATGTQPKKVVIRAIGPTLTDLGLPGALPDPTLELFQGNQLRASNDDWVLSPDREDIEHSGFAPGKNQESAIIFSLTPNQNFTAVVRGKNGQTGIAVVEAFDLDELAPVKLANISTRGFVDLGDRVMIAGLIVSPPGSANLKVLVRALGPTLGDFGVQGFLANPTLELRDSNGGLLRSSNDWKNDGQRAEIEAAQLAPAHDSEAALIQSLPPGAYTAIVLGASATTGVGLVEVYNIP